MNFKRFLLLLLGFQTVSIAAFAYQNERQLNIPYLNSFGQNYQQDNTTPSSLFSPVQKNIGPAVHRSRKLSLGVDERTYIFSSALPHLLPLILYIKSFLCRNFTVSKRTHLNQSYDWET